MFFQQAHSFYHQPVGCLFWLSTKLYCLLKYICHMLRVCKDLRVILRQAEFADITGHFLGTKLWLCRLDPGDPLITDHNGCQVRIREVTVILCIFLGTHSLGTFLVVIPTSCFLDDLPAIFDQLDLASCFSFNGMCNSLKGVNVLHLCSSAEFRCSHFTDG